MSVISRRGSSPTLLCALLLALGLAQALTAEAAWSDAPASQGWWWAANNELLPAQPPVPPDVPSDGLLVDGGPNGPLAFAALVFYLEPGATPKALNLTVASGSATTPMAAVDLCSVTSSVSAAQGGSLSSAPTYDCSHKVAGTLSSSGTSYGFDVSRLPASDTLSVALVPVAATDRVVFAKPGSSALSVVTSGPGFEPLPEFVPSPTSSPSEAASSGAPTIPENLTAGVGPQEEHTGEVPAPTLATAAPNVVASVEPQVTDQAPVTASAVSGSSSSFSRTLLILAAAAAALALWAQAGSIRTRTTTGDDASAPEDQGPHGPAARR